MRCKDRKGNIIEGTSTQDKYIKFLYENPRGKTLLKILTKSSISKMGAFFLKTGFSSRLIPTFIKNNKINMDEYEDKQYKSYNDFFIRKIKRESRTFDKNRKHFVSPCDSKLSVYKMDSNSTFKVKGVEYTFLSLTRSKKLEKKFENGYLMIFRLSVDDYHRYYYVDRGMKSKNYKIKGCFHTVNPIAGNRIPIYQENQREYSLLKSENFGEILMMEVGAMMVGKIVNYHGVKKVERGMEKGRFEFGGSTVILAVQEKQVKIDQDILKNSLENFETKVRLGEKIGVGISNS